ncbi:hypothetical protein A4U88_4458 [Serratia marcescens]|nr:hypothetical protein A4U88_4458 [Serratia marcescens]
MLIRAFLALYSPETGYSPMTAQPYHIISATDNFILARFLFLIETRFH